MSISQISFLSPANTSGLRSVSERMLKMAGKLKLVFYQSIRFTNQLNQMSFERMWHMFLLDPPLKKFLDQWQSSHIASSTIGRKSLLQKRPMSSALTC